MGINDFYRKITQAETEGESDPWIRTRHQVPEGSSAFGEAQITQRLLNEYLNNQDQMFTPEEMQFLGWLNEQQSQMLKYGGEDMVAGKERYGYGKSGDWNAEKIPRYRSAIGKMLDHVLKQSGGNELEAARRWRFGNKGAQESTNILSDRYKRHFR